MTQYVTLLIPTLGVDASEEEDAPMSTQATTRSPQATKSGPRSVTLGQLESSTALAHGQ